MRGKRRNPLVEWGKNLLILLLAACALWLLSRTQLAGGLLEGLPQLRQLPAAQTGSAAVQSEAVLPRPVRAAVCQDGQRYGVQYDQAGADELFSSLSLLISEAVGSAGGARQVSEADWRAALGSPGVYLDFLYPLPLFTLFGAQEEGGLPQGPLDPIRRLCLAAGEDGGLSLYYMDEEEGAWYSCATTLTRELHLETVLADWPPNGALFAFETAGLEDLSPYTLITATPQSAVYAAANPLLQDSARLEALLEELTFSSRGSGLDPAAGGRLVENNDDLRLSRGGLLTFHTIGDADFRFRVPGASLRDTLAYVQTLAQATAGAWCGDARLCLAGVEETADGLEITFQYTLNGSPVALSEDHAAHFVVRGGVVTDFSLYLRAYTATEETTLVLPEAQAAAAMAPLGARGKELVLLYEDLGGELAAAGWVAR